MEPRPGRIPTTYTVSEAADILRCSENFVRAAIKRGDLPGRQIGKKYSIPKRTFDDWLTRFEEPRRTDPFSMWERRR